jgi:hypothetical protein
MEQVMPYLINGDNGLIERASITKDGALTSRFEYLLDYAL